MIDNNLALQLGTDIPFPHAALTIHQPTCEEISLIGESELLLGCNLLNFSKEKLGEQDKIYSTDLTDFDILLEILKDRRNLSKRNRVAAELVLLLIFPKYKITFENNAIAFTQSDTQEISYLDNQSFPIFKEYLKEIFPLFMNLNSESEYNAKSAKARALAEKFKKYHQKLQDLNRESKDEGINILSSYISILSVGLQKDKNSFRNYTMYQLSDEFERFRLKQEFDLYVSQKLAGAKDIEDVKNWMGDIHSDKDKKD